jgi:hypothetical protein
MYLKAGDNSTISYVMPMIAGPKGYEPHVDLCLDTFTITSNVNDIRLLAAETCHVRDAFVAQLFLTLTGISDSL